MGTFEIPLEIGDLQGLRFERVDALVDTGSTYTLVPRSLLRRLGVEVQERRPFQLADERVEYDVGQAQVRLQDRKRFTVVIFGEEGVAPLLGAVTLEEFGLSVDPVRQRLVPVSGLLK